VPSLPKPEKPAPAPRRRIANKPKCECGHSYSKHRFGLASGSWCDGLDCDCAGYRYPAARSSVLRSPVARKKAQFRDCACGYHMAHLKLPACDGTGAGCACRRPARLSAPARAKRPRKQRKTPLATLKRLLWEHFRSYVKARDGNVCFICGAPGLEGQNWHAGHLFNAGNNSVIKYHPLNVHSNCGRCNVWLRGNIAVYAVRFLDVYGLAQLQALDSKRGVAKAWKRSDIEPMIAALKRGGADYETFYAETYGL
jgi:hypothetical protein